MITTNVPAKTQQAYQTLGGTVRQALRRHRPPNQPKT